MSVSLDLAVADIGQLNDQVIGHCIDIIKQVLMCSADAEVFGQWWVKDIGPFVDFGHRHKCKNFTDIVWWAHSRQVRSDRRVVFRPGDVMLPGVS
jgi:Mycotoxin biosynthesis protein UstYa